MLIECSYCQCRVDGEVLCENREYDPQEEPYPTKVILLKCPSCHRALLGISEQIQVGHNDWEWDNLNRVWPEPENYLHFSIPSEVRSSLEEARTCYRARAFSMLL